MSYADERLASFTANARTLFDDYAACYREKEGLYLKDTHFLKLRVVHRLVEDMRRDLLSMAEAVLQECSDQHPQAYDSLKMRLSPVIDHYLSCFRSQDWQQGQQAFEAGH